LGHQGVLGLPARRIRGLAGASGLAQKLETDRQLPVLAPLQRSKVLGRAIGACVARPLEGLALARVCLSRLVLPRLMVSRLGLSRLSRARLTLARRSRTRIGQA
jgi:hypothetical protein